MKEKMVSQLGLIFARTRVYTNDNWYVFRLRKNHACGVFTFVAIAYNSKLRNSSNQKNIIAYRLRKLPVLLYSLC